MGDPCANNGKKCGGIITSEPLSCGITMRYVYVRTIYGICANGLTCSCGVRQNMLVSAPGGLVVTRYVGWAGGSAGPDFFIYAALAPATSWNHDHTVWGQVRTMFYINKQITLMELSSKRVLS
eukprot:8776411-Pyramimonas_sp.AAC.1